MHDRVHGIDVSGFALIHAALRAVGDTLEIHYEIEFPRKELSEVHAARAEDTYTVER
jgi:hypothetical protein